MRGHARLAALAGIMLGSVLAAGPARADVIGAMPDESFAATPATLSLGSGSFTFTAIPNAFPGNPTAAVNTAGSAEVSSLLGGVTDFSAGSTIDQAGELYGFSAFAAPVTIPDSAADDFIGLAFMNSSGLHYGYAEIAGTELVSYGYSTVPDGSITTGAGPTAVPEPSTIVLLATGMLGLVWAGAGRRRAAFVRGEA